MYIYDVRTYVALHVREGKECRGKAQSSDNMPAWKNDQEQDMINAHKRGVAEAPGAVHPCGGGIRDTLHIKVRILLPDGRYLPDIWQMNRMISGWDWFSNHIIIENNCIY